MSLSLEGYNWLFSVWSRGATQKPRKSLGNSFLQFFEKVTLDPSLVSAPYVPHVLVCFGWFKTWWMHWVELHKTSLYSKGKDAMIIDFKLKILIWFNSPILKHLTCLTPNIADSIPSPNWAMFPTLEGLGPGLQMFVELQKQRNNVQRFDLLWVLKCSFTHQPIYSKMKTSQNTSCMWLGNVSPNDINVPLYFSILNIERFQVQHY